MVAEQLKPPDPHSHGVPATFRVVVTPMGTKFVFLYPSVLLALIMSILTGLSHTEATQNLWGQVFLFVVFVNFIVASFEFPRSTVLNVVFGVVAFVLGLYFLNQWLDFMPELARWFRELNVRATWQFYLCLFVGGSALLGVALFMTRFDYWELTPNQLIHHHGLLGDIEQFSTAGMKFNKEITDIFEYLILRSATLVINVPTQNRPIVLENVLFINFVIQKAEAILSGKLVREEKMPPDASGPGPANVAAANDL